MDPFRLNLHPVRSGHRAAAVFALSLGLIFSGVLPAAMRAAEAPAPLIPLESFFRLPEVASFKLSPDGTYVAFSAPVGGRQTLQVKRIGEAGAKQLTTPAAGNVGGVFWLNDQRLAYAIDAGGREATRIYAVDRDGSNARPLTPEGVRAGIVTQLPHDGGLLATLMPREARAPDLYKIDVNTGEAELVVKNDRNYVRYVSDNAGVVRLAMATDGVNVTLYHRSTDTAPFERVITADFRDSFAPLFFTGDNRFFYARSNRNRDKIAIVRIDPKDGTEVEVVYQHPDYDVAGLIRDPKEDRIVGAHYVGEKTERVFFDDRARERHLDIARQLPGLEVEIVSNNRARTASIVKAWSDRDPGTFYHYEEATKRLTLIGTVAPWLDLQQLAAIQPIRYRSRDGLTIHGYLTRPKGATGPLPTLLVIHGGPWQRDEWRADPEIQFLANRGYAVLQINFRGSTGYGRAFVEAGFKQWGRAMQNDITDGVRWLIDEKIADPGRIGIYGISYGGYATLAGLAFTPELFRCGIADSGVSDIGEWLSTLPPRAQAVRAMLYTMVGDPEADRDALAAVSPRQHADRIKAPLLLAHGGNDPRVSQSHSEKMAAALTARGADVETLFKANEGHSFHLEENRLEFYRRAERFLAKHLGGRSSEAVAKN